MLISKCPAAPVAAILVAPGALPQTESRVCLYLKNGVPRGKIPVFSIATLVTLVLASALAFPAWAGRPLATEDAGVLDRGECEIESYAGRIRNSDSPSVNTRWAQFSCGTGRDTQLTFGGGTEKSDGEQKTIGALAGKTFLRELTDEETGFTLAYALFGAQNPGNSFRHEATELKAVVSVPHSGWLLHTNLGLHHSRTSNTYSAIWGLAVESPGAAGPVDLMAEIVGDERSAPWVQVAARWAVIAKRLYLDTSWGVQADSARSQQVTVGLKLVF
jgi:hypothetical protein